MPSSINPGILPDLFAAVSLKLALTTANTLKLVFFAYYSAEAETLALILKDPLLSFNLALSETHLQ